MHHGKTRALVLAFGMLAAGCSSAAPSAGASGAVATQFHLRGADANAPEQAGGKSYDQFAQCVNQRSNGLIDLKIFHSAQLGSDAAALELLQNGGLDFTESTIFSNAIPQAAVFDLPFLFKDEAHWAKAVDGAPGKTIADAGIAKGIHILSYDIGGWRDIYGNKKIETAADLKDVKIRTLQSPAYVQLFQALGAVPVPLAFTEVYLGLQQGTLDLAETALPSMVGSKQYEVSKYVAATHHGLSSVMWAISEKTWQSLPKDAQATVVACDAERTAFERKQILTDATAIDTQLQTTNHLEYTHPDRAPFVEAAQTQVYPKVITTPELQTLLQQVIDLGK
jgi:tripartite ATP-independent transporter DctP family solute receptor